MAQTITLNKLNKIIEKLKKELHVQRNGQAMIRFDNVIKVNIQDPVKDFSKFSDKINNSLQNETVKLEGYLTLYHDYLNLKEILFNTNISSGLSTILTNIVKENEIIQIYKGLVNNDKTSRLDIIINEPSDITKEYIEDINNKFQTTTESSYFRILYINAVNVREYEMRLTEALKRLSVLEDKREQLNAETRVQVSLSEKTRNIVGI
jgi:hypothetical protein